MFRTDRGDCLVIFSWKCRRQINCKSTTKTEHQLIYFDDQTIVSVILGHSNVGGQLVAGYNKSTYNSEHQQILQYVADKLEVIEGRESNG